MKARLIALFLFTSIVFFAFCGTAWATYTTNQLTSNAYADTSPQISGAGEVVWVENHPPWWNELEGMFFPGDIFIVRYSGGTTNLIWGCWGCNSTYESHPVPVPHMNDAGQVVWQYREAIYLYSDGATTQIAENAREWDWPPQINDSGQVVWQGYDGSDDEIYRYSGGVITQLTDNGYNDYNPQINDSGQVVWVGDGGIYLYSGGIATQLTVNDNYNSPDSPQINNAGEVVWSEHDEASVDLNVFLYRNGSTTRISSNDHMYGPNQQVQDSSPRINDAGQVVWNRFVVWQDFWSGQWLTQLEICLYTSGATMRLTDRANGENPQISNTGGVAWIGWDGEDYEVYFYNGGVTTQITHNSYSEYNPQINDAGQVVWEGYDGNDWEIYLASPSSCSGEKPSLALSRGDVFWESYADYLAGELSVTMTVSTPGTVSTSQVQIIGSTNTDGVTLSTVVPALVGDIAGGASSSVALKYHVPSGVGAFMTFVYATAQDSCGTTYSYPGPYPES